jgi:hypothetical protein
MSFDKLLNMNNNWWESMDDTYHPLNYSYYKVIDIFDSVDINSFLLLRELNKYIITVDSQDGSCEEESSLSPIEFIRQQKLEHLSEIPARELQRPYVDFLCEQGLANELLKLQDYGIACLHGNRFIYNDLFRSKFMNETQVNLTKAVFDNGVETYYTNFNSDSTYHIYIEFGPLDDYTFVKMIANDYCDSNSELLNTLLEVIKNYYA